MSQEKDFSEGKKKSLLKLKNAIKNKEVDENILPILNLINESEDFFTTSSCFGRIVLLEIPIIGDKKNARFLGKWHRTIEINEFIEARKNAITGQLWLLAQSPVIHIVANNIYNADKILKLAISCGFKHSGIKSFDKKNVVEICSTERIDAPIGKNKEFFCNDIYLQLLIDISNEVIQKSTKKLNKFQEKLKNL